ncbi:pilus assembly protein PilX [Pseudomonas sp. NFXW11]|uniref:pilus assembly PilX family protein n=1 Tax=Pseudomonas sp. NFXW11 TaxID=2819531 RepID=UPI003CEFAD76
MALLISLVLLSLLSMLGLSALQNATLQAKMAASLLQHHRAFQAAEAALRLGEAAVRRHGKGWAPCSGTVQCAPPAESPVVDSAGLQPGSAVTWVATGNGFYGVQNLGTTQDAVHLPPGTVAKLYRVTGIGLAGQARSVLETVYAIY